MKGTKTCKPQAQHYKSTYCLGVGPKSTCQNTHTVGAGSKLASELPKHTWDYAVSKLLIIANIHIEACRKLAPSICNNAFISLGFLHALLAKMHRMQVEP